MSELPIALFTDDEVLRASFPPLAEREPRARWRPRCRAMRWDCASAPKGAAVIGWARRRRRAVSPRAAPDALEGRVDLEYPVAEIETLAFVLRGLLDARGAARDP